MTQTQVSYVNNANSGSLPITQRRDESQSFEIALANAQPKPKPPQSSPPPHKMLGNVVDADNSFRIDENELKNATPMTNEQIGQQIANSLNQKNLVNIVGVGEDHQEPPVEATLAAIKQSRANGREVVALIELPTQEYGSILQNYNNGSISDEELTQQMENVYGKDAGPDGLYEHQKKLINSVSRYVIEAKKLGAEVGVIDTNNRSENRDAVMEQNVAKKVDQITQKGTPTDVYLKLGASHAGVRGDQGTSPSSGADFANPLIKRLETRYGDDMVEGLVVVSPDTPTNMLEVRDYEQFYITPKSKK